MQWMSAPNIAGAPLPQRARGSWKARVAAARESLEGFLERERAQLPPWCVVAFGSGIAAWFVLGGTVQWQAFICFAAGIGLAGFAVPGGGRSERAVGWLGLAAALGCTLVWLRSEWVGAPRVQRPKVVEFTARVERVERLLAKGDTRLLLAPTNRGLPPRVRVTAKTEGMPLGIAPDAVVQLRARLAPPPPMALPGSYDFARDAWFKGIGGVGRTLGDIEVLRPGEQGLLDSARERLGRHIRSRLPPSEGAIAAALATGDQAAVSEEDAEAMRRSGLTHLLSVSGLHIAAVVGAAMLLTLRLLALSQRLALHTNLVLVSAGIGAVTGIAYTLLTGAQVPTVRSCIAALLVPAGIALGRDAISIRLLSVGALVVLIFRPEALAGASFQFSFAAVAAIIALHSSGWARRHLQAREEAWWGRVLRWLLSMVATGLAVEFALIPFALFHFHKAGLYGVAANIVAIPLTTFVIMPTEAVALLLDLAGLGAPAWTVARWSLGLLLGLAHAVATSGAVATLASMPSWSFGLIVAGGLWLCLWTSRARVLGLVPATAGAVGAALSPAPDLLVTGDGRHVAVVRGGVPLLVRERSGVFVRDILAEGAGYDGEPEDLAGRSMSHCTKDSCVASIERGGRSWRLLATRSSTRIDWSRIVHACRQADIVVADRWLPKACKPRWLKLDRRALEQSGGVAVFLGSRPYVRSVAQRVGSHPWATHAQPQNMLRTGTLSRETRDAPVRH